MTAVKPILWSVKHVQLADQLFVIEQLKRVTLSWNLICRESPLNTFTCKPGANFRLETDGSDQIYVPSNSTNALNLQGRFTTGRLQVRAQTSTRKPMYCVPHRVGERFFVTRSTQAKTPVLRSVQTALCSVEGRPVVFAIRVRNKGTGPS